MIARERVLVVAVDFAHFSSLADFFSSSALYCSSPKIV